MTSFLLVFLPPDEETEAATALTQLRALATDSDLILVGPIEIEDSIPLTEAARLSRAAEILKETARRKRIAEGLARAKRAGRRIGRPPSVPPATIAQVVLARDSGQSWRSIEAKYRVPMTSARRLCQKELLKGGKDGRDGVSKQEAKRS